MRRFTLWLFVLLLMSAAPTTAAPQADDDRVLRIGTKSAPPFAMRNADGRWMGISIELWRQVASEADLEFEFVEADLAELIDGLAEGRLDASVAALTVTAERERQIDFCHSFFESGLGIAVPGESSSGWSAILKDIQLVRFLKTLAALAGVLLGAGLLMWLFECRKNAEQFPPDMKGLGDGFWWSAVTMTTVGYGDKAPRTGPGRILGLLWMFASVFLISAFTATIASALTAQQLHGRVRGPEDLPHVRVGTIADSTADQHLQSRQLRPLTFPDAEAALEALIDDRLDAIVYDAPILQYLIRNRYEHAAKVLPEQLALESYAFGLPPNSPLREPVNRAMLEELTRQEWRDTLTRYFGP